MCFKRLWLNILFVFEKHLKSFWPLRKFLNFYRLQCKHFGHHWCVMKYSAHHNIDGVYILSRCWRRRSFFIYSSCTFFFAAICVRVKIGGDGSYDNNSINIMCTTYAKHAIYARVFSRERKHRHETKDPERPRFRRFSVIYCAALIFEPN